MPQSTIFRCSIWPRKGVASILPGPFGPVEAWAQAPTAAAATAFISQTGQELVAVVNSSISDDARRAKLGEVINRTVDVPGVAQFCLGRFWRLATPAQQHRLPQPGVLLSQLALQTGERFEIERRRRSATGADAGSSIDNCCLLTKSR